MVQLYRDVFRKGPAQNRQVEHLGGDKPDRGRGHVIGMTCHPSHVEDQQPVSATGVGGGGHLAGQPRPAHLAQGPVGVVKQSGTGHTEHLGRGGQLSLAH